MPGSARLLHLSANRSNPDGLAKRSGLMGKRLMLHPLARVTGLFKDQINGHRGFLPARWLVTISMKQKYKEGSSAALNCRRSGHMACFTARIAWAQDPMGYRAPRGTRTSFRSCSQSSICSDDMPVLQNQVSLSDVLAADDGLPAAKMIYRTPDDARKALDFAQQRSSASSRCYETLKLRHCGKRASILWDHAHGKRSRYIRDKWMV